MKTISNIQTRWGRLHGQRERMAYRMLRTAFVDTALKVPVNQLAGALAPGAIQGSVTGEKIEQAIMRIWIINATDEGENLLREVTNQWGKKDLSVEQLRALLVRQIRSLRRLQTASITATFTAYLVKQIQIIQEQTTELDEVVARWLGLIASTGFYASYMGRIARTETTASTNYGRQATAETLGVRMQKTWLTMLDERVRDKPYPGFSHRVLHGQTVPAGERFSGGGAPIRYPGDPRAPIGMTINCRCLAVYAPLRDRRGRIVI